MVVFWALAAMLTVATILVILSPLLRRSREEVSRAAYDVHVYRDQLAEIERDIEQGFLSPDQAATASSEIKRRLLAVIDSGQPKTPGIGRALGRTMIGAIALAVPVGILSLYMFLGIPTLPDNPLSGRTDEAEMAIEEVHFTSMAESLEARLEEEPDDIEGWLMLGRTYNTLGRTRDSINAHSRAYALSPDNPVAAVGYGEALVIDARGHVSEVALKAFNAALKAEPGNFKGRYFIGLSKSQTPGGMAEAIDIWASILKGASPEAPWRGQLEDMIERAKKALENEAATDKAAPETPEG